MKKCISMCMTLTMFFSLSMSALSAKADNTDYGVDAYQYMRYLNDVHPDRVQGTQQVREAGYWVMTTLQSFGYEVEVYTYNDFGMDIVNYIATKPGNSGQCVYVGSHYDCVAGDTRGADDNGSGVGVNLELAKRFVDVPTNDTIKFCFWDAEELEYACLGSYKYTENMSQEEKDNCLLYINLDCVAAGDSLYAYSGVYDDNYNLSQIWPLYMADYVSARLGLTLKHMPDSITYYDSPTRSGSSDNYYFCMSGIPYLYFEANCWIRPDGSMNTEHPWMLTSSNEAFLNTNGQIMHTGNDNMDIIESAVPGTIQRNLTATSTIVSQILRELGAQSPVDYAVPVQAENSEVAAGTTEEMIEVNEETAEENGETVETNEETIEEKGETVETNVEAMEETGKMAQTDEETSGTVEISDEVSETARTSENASKAVETTAQVESESEEPLADISQKNADDVSKQDKANHTPLGVWAGAAVLAAIVAVFVWAKKRK